MTKKEEKAASGNGLYVCRKCKEEIKNLGKFVRCTKCGSRVLYKNRKPVAKEVSTN